MDAGGVVVGLRLRPHRQHRRQAHPGRPRLRQRVDQRQRPDAVRVDANALHPEPRRAAGRAAIQWRWRARTSGSDGPRVCSTSTRRAVPITRPSSKRSTTPAALQNFVANDVYTTDNKSAFVHVTLRLHRAAARIGRRALHGRVEDQHVRSRPRAQPLRRPADLRRLPHGLESSASTSRLPTTSFCTRKRPRASASESATPRIFTVGQLMALAGRGAVEPGDRRKLEFLDNRLRLNAAVFTSDYDPRVRQTGGVNQCDAPTSLNPIPYRLQGGYCPPARSSRARRACRGSSTTTRRASSTATSWS